MNNSIVNGVIIKGMKELEFSLIVFVLIFSLLVLWICRKRNAWDIMFFNTTLATLSLFVIGILAKNNDVWIAIVAVLGIVATGEKILGFFMKPTNKESKNNQNVTY